MKIKLPTILQVFRLSLLLINISLFGQVGINTTTPNGILEVSSSTQGVVLPRIALTSTILEAPVLNPQGGHIVPGTVIYNTATTSGTNAVYPGIYVWTGTEWQNKFTKKQTEIFKQTSMVRTVSTGSYQNITNLVGRTFTPKYTGKYRVEVSVNYGGGYVTDLSPNMDTAAQLGNFKFSLTGSTDKIIPAKTYCTLLGTRYYAIWQQTFSVDTITLNSGSAYTFSLAFDQLASTGFEGNGDTGNGLGYIGIPDHVPCSVEFTYIGN